MKLRTMLAIGGTAAYTLLGTGCTPQEVAWWAEHPEAQYLLGEHTSDTPEIYPGQPAYEPCLDDHGVVYAYATDDPGQTTLDCDVRPPQRLDIVFDEVSWGSHDGWGGDASLEWAANECDGMGGEPIWDSVAMTCEGVDY